MFIIVGKYTHSTGIKPITAWVIQEAGRKTDKRYYKHAVRPASSWNDTYWAAKEVIKEFATKQQADDYMDAAKLAVVDLKLAFDHAERVARDTGNALNDARTELQRATNAFVDA